MENKIETKWEELWPMVNVLNEVCHGMHVNDFEAEVGFKYENIYALLRKLSDLEIEDDKREMKLLITLNDQEIEILKNSFNRVLKEIEEWEFSTRIGVSIDEATKLKEKLTSTVS